MLLALLGCQGGAGNTPAPTPAAPRVLEVRDAKGTVVTAVHPGTPCSAKIDGVDLAVAGKPPALHAGSATWTTEARPNGTAVLKDGELIARVATRQEDVAAAYTDVVDPKGIALLRIKQLHHITSVTNAGSVKLRGAAREGDAIVVGDERVTGTTDEQLAALVTAPEVPPEVRALVACDWFRAEKVQ
jgi:hypothetical protein